MRRTASCYAKSHAIMMILARRRIPTMTNSHDVHDDGGRNLSETKFYHWWWLWWLIILLLSWPSMENKVRNSCKHEQTFNQLTSFVLQQDDDHVSKFHKYSSDDDDDDVSGSKCKAMQGKHMLTFHTPWNAAQAINWVLKQKNGLHGYHGYSWMNLSKSCWNLK